jgi:hypothetical protein
MTVAIPDPDERTQRLFELLFSLESEFPGRWCLIGGYMVYLLALEAGLPVRQTTDADVLADPAQGLLRKISEYLIRRYGMVSEETPSGNRYRFRGPGESANTLVVDLLAMDKPGPRADLRTDPPGTTLEVPGGRQALNSTRTIDVRVGTVTGRIAVPSLAGALRLKLEALNLSGGAGSVERHLQDLALLLALVDDPIEFRNQLKASYRRRLAATALAIRSSDSWSHLPTELADQGHAALILISSSEQ